MKLLLALIIAAPLFGLQQMPIHLEPGEYRWIPFTVRQIPTEVECSFRVTKGDPAVHLELLTIQDFHLFNRGREHDALATSPAARSGDFRRIVEVRGEYAVVLINGARLKPAEVVLEVSTDSNPTVTVTAKELSSGRRLSVILISFAIFFTAITWSGVALTRAIIYESAPRVKR